MASIQTNSRQERRYKAIQKHEGGVMKRTLFLSVAFIIMSVVCVPADAEDIGKIVEKKIAITLKCYADGEAYVNGDAAIKPGDVFTITAKDIIQEISTWKLVSFGNSATIVLREHYIDGQENPTESEFVIRDKNKTDYDISDYIAVTQGESFGKYNYSISKGTGTYTDYAMMKIVITINDKKLELRGMMVEKGSQKSPDAYVTVSNSSAKMAGELSEGGEVVAVVEGTVKTSGAKILK
jgi:hypothetical protein